MEELRKTIEEEDPTFGSDCDLRPLQEESLERHRAAGRLNHVPEQTFTRALKWVFLSVLTVSLLSNALLSQQCFLSPECHRWNTKPGPSWPFFPNVTILLTIMFGAAVYGIWRKLKNRRAPAPQRKVDIQTVSASIQWV